MRLGDGEQCDVPGVPPDPAGGRGDARQDVRAPPDQLVHRGQVDQSRLDFSLASAPFLA